MGFSYKCQDHLKASSQYKKLLKKMRKINQSFISLFLFSLVDAHDKERIVFRTEMYIIMHSTEVLTKTM